MQVGPAIWTAWRTTQPTGVAASTWALILVESILWGTYGLAHRDPATSMMAVLGVAGSVAILTRKVVVRRCVQEAQADDIAHVAAAASVAGHDKALSSVAERHTVLGDGDEDLLALVCRPRDSVVLGDHHLGRRDDDDHLVTLRSSWAGRYRCSRSSASDVLNVIA